MEHSWQQEGPVWFYIAGTVVYAAQIVPAGKLFNAFDLTEQIPEGQAGPVRIGEYSSVDEAKAAVEKHFEEQMK